MPSVVRQYRSFDGPSGNNGRRFNMKYGVFWSKAGGDYIDGAGARNAAVPTRYTNEAGSYAHVASPGNSDLYAERSFSSADLDVERGINVTAIVQRWQSDLTNDKGFLLHCTTNYGVRFWPRSTGSPGGTYAKRPRLVVKTDVNEWTCEVTATCMATTSNTSDNWKNPNASPGSGAGFGPCNTTRAHLQFDMSMVTGTVVYAYLYLTVRPRTDTGTYLGSGSSVVKVLELDAPYIRVGAENPIGPYSAGVSASYPNDVGIESDSRITHKFPYELYPYRRIRGSDGQTFNIARAGEWWNSGSLPTNLKYMNRVVATDGSNDEYYYAKVESKSGVDLVWGGWIYQAPATWSAGSPWGGNMRAQAEGLTPPIGAQGVLPARVINEGRIRYVARWASNWMDTTDEYKCLASIAGEFGRWEGDQWSSSSVVGGGAYSNGKLEYINGRWTVRGWSLRTHGGKAFRHTGYAHLNPPLGERHTPWDLDNPYDELVDMRFYVYWPGQAGTYGDEFYWGLMLQKEVNYSIEIYVKMNTVGGLIDGLGNGTGIADGIIRVWIDGWLMYEKLDHIFRQNEGWGIQNCIYENWVHGGTWPESYVEFDQQRWIGKYVYSETDYIGPLNTTGVIIPPPPDEPPPVTRVPGLQYSVTNRNAQLDAMVAALGATPKLRIYDGQLPLNCAAALSGNTLLAEMTLPTPFLLTAANGVVVATGTWEDPSANAGGTATFFRIYDAAGTTCHMQGTVSQTGGPGDLKLVNPVIVAGQTVRVRTFRVRALGE